MHIELFGNAIEIATTTFRSIKWIRATIRMIAIQLEQWYEQQSRWNKRNSTATAK